MTTTPIKLTKAQARDYMTGQLRLRRFEPKRGAQGARALLEALGCIQLDPLDRIGTNADLVAFARVHGLKRGQIYEATLGQWGFEHFAKERCILPARAFPHYREQLVRAPWYDHNAREAGVDEEILAAILAQISAQGPSTLKALDDHGKTQAPGWHGVKAVAATKLAVEVLWARCQLVVCGREGKHKRYDLPSRALPDWHDVEPTHSFEHWALLERVESAALLGHHAGPHWSSIAAHRKGPLGASLEAQGLLVQAQIEDDRRRYWAPADLLSRAFPEQDEHMRVLAPLDPLLWDRGLVKHCFGFDYVWEVYKPADKRQWGYYVCPLLYQGQLVGRVEARRNPDGQTIAIDKLWLEPDQPWSQEAFEAAMGRLEEAQ